MVAGQCQGGPGQDRGVLRQRQVARDLGQRGFEIAPGLVHIALDEETEAAQGIEEGPWPGALRPPETPPRAVHQIAHQDRTTRLEQGDAGQGAQHHRVEAAARRRLDQGLEQLQGARGVIALEPVHPAQQMQFDRGFRLAGLGECLDGAQGQFEALHTIAGQLGPADRQEQVDLPAPGLPRQGVGQLQQLGEMRVADQLPRRPRQQLYAAREVAGRLGVANGFDVQAVSGEPLAGGQVYPGHFRRWQPVPASLQVSGEHLVEAEPLQAALKVDGQQEEVLRQQYVEQRAALGVPRQRRAQLAIESPAGRHLHHGCDLSGGKDAADAVIEVGIDTRLVDCHARAAAGVETAFEIAAVAQRQDPYLQTGGPTVGQFVQALLLLPGQAVETVEFEQAELLLGRQAQVGKIDLGQLPLDAERQQAERRALACGDHQVEVVRGQVDQPLDHPQRRRRREEMQILQEQIDGTRMFVEGVDQQGQQNLQRALVAALAQADHLVADRQARGLQAGDQVSGPQGLVIRPQVEPGDVVTGADQPLPPLCCQGGLAAARRPQDQRQLALAPRLEQFEQALARQRPGVDARR
ncbi:hypothetical protein D9M69_392720 [compost metagenome]